MDARSTRLRLVAVYTVVFSLLLKAFTTEHYPLFVLSGLATWVFFQSAVQMSCSSLFAQPTLVRQAGFPRQMLPLAVVATNVVTLAAMMTVVIAVNLIVIPETRTTFWAAIPMLIPLVLLLERPGCCARLRHRRLSRCGAPYEHDLPSVVLPDAGLLHPGKPPGNRGSTRGLPMPSTT